MLLQFCDKCGRPLSEGCLARGEAQEHKGELVCAPCIAKEQTEQAVHAEKRADAGPLGQYEQAVWNCESCGIPVKAVDLIEGRAVRIGGQLKCSRCSPAAKAAPVAVPQANPAPAQRIAPARPAPARASARGPLAVPRTGRQSSTESYVAEARSEQRRPIIPIVMFAIVMPMFAVSLYFAITSQVKLNEVMGGQEGAGNEEMDRRQRRPREELKVDLPDNTPRANTQPPADGGTRPDPQPEPPAPGPAVKPLPKEVVDELVGVERELAAPVITKLQSADLAEVWEALLEAGSRRLIGARPHVRALLGDKDDQTRALACRVCGMLSDREALLQLTRMVEHDPAEAVRIEARKARDRLTGEATRDIRDLTDAELEEMQRDIKRELERRKGKSD